MKRTRSQHEPRIVRDSRRFFREVRGEVAYRRRRSQIARLPRRTWKGRPLRTIRCTGETGDGPHLRHEPESLLWSLIDLRRYRCPFHMR